MIELKVEITGHTESDLEQALDEIRKKVATGFRMGKDGNDTGVYNFEATGSPVSYYRIRRSNKISKKRYGSFYEASEAAGNKDKIVMFDDSNYELGIVGERIRKESDRIVYPKPSR